MSGICNICGQDGKMYTCALCGSLVCSRCYLPEKGICKRCQKGLKFRNDTNDH